MSDFVKIDKVIKANIFKENNKFYLFYKVQIKDKIYTFPKIDLNHEIAVSLISKQKYNYDTFKSDYELDNQLEITFLSSLDNVLLFSKKREE